MADYSLIEKNIEKIEGNIGKSSIDLSEISSIFPNAYESVNLVNEFNSKLLFNIAYIYNIKGQDAFGVFNPSLNDTVNWIRVKKQLINEGFQTNIKNDVGQNDKLYAFAPNMTKEQVDEKMNKIFQDKTKTGGSVIGVDAERIISIVDSMTSSQENSSLTDDQKTKLKICQMAAVIGHEAVHALGDTGESGPEKIQKEIMNYGINKFSLPIQLTQQTVHAESMNWYKKAQVVPFQWVALELILRNNNKFDEALFPVKHKQHQSVETLLENNLHTDLNKNNKKSLDGILEDERKDDFKDYPKSIEEKLDGEREHPLIINIPKKSHLENSMVKEASWGSNLGGPFIGGSFGYMNGFNDSWGQPFEADEIHDNPYDAENSGNAFWLRRYNPLYARGQYTTDKFGHPEFNYDVQVDLASDEWRSKPTSFANRDTYWPNRSDIAVASTKENFDEYQFSLYIAKKMGYLKNLIKNNNRKSARLIFDEKALDIATQCLNGYKTVVYPAKNHYCLWVTTDNIENINNIEGLINSHTNRDVVNEHFNVENTIKENINHIMSKCKLIVKLYKIKNSYVVGGFVRTLVQDKKYSNINDIDFSSPYADECLKLGGLLAEELGVNDIGFYNRTRTMSFEYEGMKMDFRGKNVDKDIRDLMRHYNIKCTPLNFDIYGRDFTMNSLVYDFCENKIYDISKRGLKDLKDGVIKTFFNPEEIIPRNPILITRAIILYLNGYKLDSDIERCLIKNSQELFNGKVSDQRLAYECEKILKYGDEGSEQIIKYKLNKIIEFKNKLSLNREI